MLYMDADDAVLERDVLFDLNEAEVIGSTADVQIVAQIDRYKGGYAGDGDWTTTRRFHVTKDGDLQHLHSEQLSDEGELNMADGGTLSDFVAWAAEAYPADQYVLVMSDHGMGWPGGWTDAATRGIGPDRITMARLMGADAIWLMELERALKDIKARSGVGRFALIGMDACLMAQLEVFSALRPYARYAVASEETEPALGWAYTAVLKQLVANPAMSPATLGRAIVQTYIRDDQRILDTASRRELVAGMTGDSADVPVAELVKYLSTDITLAAVDLDRIPAVEDALFALISVLQDYDQEVFAEVRAYAQPFANVFAEELPSPYIDLGSFSGIVLAQDPPAEVARPCRQLQRALAAAVVASTHGPDRPGAGGISIFFPVWDIYRSHNDVGYRQVVRTFERRTAWADYLDLHYRLLSARAREATDKGSGGGASAASRATAVPLRIDPIKASREVVRPGAPARLRTTVRGTDLAYLYVFDGHLIKNGSVLLVDDIDYLMADKTRTVNGVVFPDYASSTVKIDYEYEPSSYVVTDGAGSVKAAPLPEAYDLTTPSYTVDGMYTFNDGTDRWGRLYFSGDTLRKVLLFSGQGSGAPRAVTPAAGDAFTVERDGYYIDPGKDGKLYVAPGGTLTFGRGAITWEQVAPGSSVRVVGFIAEDFSGRTVEEYTMLEYRR
jgi:hypothetical protein